MVYQEGAGPDHLNGYTAEGAQVGGRESWGTAHRYPHTYSRCSHTHRRDSACPHEFDINSLMMVSVCFVHVFASSAALLGVLVRK